MTNICKLNFNIHFRANDAYDGMFMDIDIGVLIMKHLSNELGIQGRECVHTIHSLCFYEKDIEQIESLYSKLKNI